MSRIETFIFWRFHRSQHRWLPFTLAAMLHAGAICLLLSMMESSARLTMNGVGGSGHGPSGAIVSESSGDGAATREKLGTILPPFAPLQRVDLSRMTRLVQERAPSKWQDNSITFQALADLASLPPTSSSEMAPTMTLAKLSLGPAPSRPAARDEGVASDQSGTSRENRLATDVSFAMPANALTDELESTPALAKGEQGSTASAGNNLGRGGSGAGGGFGSARNHGIGEPLYPPESVRRGEEGVVCLRIEILSGGRAGKIEVIASSGFPRLDSAAIAAVRHAARIVGDVASHATIVQKFRFSLRDE